MSQIEKVSEPRKLFRYAINRHIQQDANERMVFYRVNRWRFNTFNRVNFLKFLRLKGPITFVVGLCIVDNYAYQFYDNPAHH